MMMGGGTICDQTAYPTGKPTPETPRDALDFPIPNASAIPEYYDMMIEAQGDPAVVWQNQFMQRWLYLDGTLETDLTDSEFSHKYFLDDTPTKNISSTTSLPDPNCQMKLLYNVPVTEPTAHPHLLEALKTAKKCIHIEIPYLLLNDILTICEQKAKEGVKVNYLLPGHSPRLAEWITNLAMTHWFRKQVTLPNVDIRLCNNRYNHGKIVAIDLKDNEAAKAFVMTGNLEPVISGGSRGGVVYDSTCMLYNMTQPLINNITKIITRDFSDDFSTSITPGTLEKQYWYEALGACLLYHKFQYFQ
jgi:phosphatidylserine/phosphatidylglycerophosphate/cardiolipin synthase-like enzyme